MLIHLPLVTSHFDLIEKAKAHFGRIFWSFGIELCDWNDLVSCSNLSGVLDVGQEGCNGTNEAMQ